MLRTEDDLLSLSWLHGSSHRCLQFSRIGSSCPAATLLLALQQSLDELRNHNLQPDCCLDPGTNNIDSHVICTCCHVTQPDKSFLHSFGPSARPIQDTTSACRYVCMLNRCPAFARCTTPSKTRVTFIGRTHNISRTMATKADLDAVPVSCVTASMQID